MTQQTVDSQMLAALEQVLANYGSIYPSDMDRPIAMAKAAVARAKRLSTPTGNPKYPDSPIGYCGDSDSLHECGRDRSAVGIHECGLPGCHLPEDTA